MTKLFIGGFPLEMTEMELVQLIAPYADVLTIKLVRDRATKVCKGYGFIEIKDEEQASSVIAALNGTELLGRVLTLNRVLEPVPVVKPTGQYTKVERNSPAAPIKRPRRPRI